MAVDTAVAVAFDAAVAGRVAVVFGAAFAIRLGVGIGGAPDWVVGVALTAAGGVGGARCSSPCTDEYIKRNAPAPSPPRIKRDPRIILGELAA